MKRNSREREETGRKTVPGAGTRQGRARASSRSWAAHTCSRAGGEVKAPGRLPAAPSAFVLWLERVPVGRERPLPSLEDPTAERTPTSAPEARRPLGVHSRCTEAEGGGDRPRERIGGNLSRPAPLLGLKSKPPVLCFLCLCLWPLVGDSLSSKGAAECGSPTPGGCPQPCLHHPCLPLLCKTQMDTRKASNTISKLNRQ